MNVLEDPSSDVSIVLLEHHVRRAGPKLQHVVPAAVTQPEQLPLHLVLGMRDDSGFQVHADGWSAVWRGVDPDTELQWHYRRSDNTNTITHRWRGIDGGTATGSAVQRVEQTIGQLYMPLPRAWDEEVERILGSRWHFAHIRVGAEHSAVFFPDGPFRAIIVPILAERAPGFAHRWVELVRSVNPPFPLGTALLRLRCDTAYADGQDGSDEADPAPLVARCRRQTGRDPARPPQRVRLSNGMGAWEIERSVLCAEILVPFRGLTMVASMLAEADVLTPVHETFMLREDRPDGAVPLIVPIEVSRSSEYSMRIPPGKIRLRWVLSQRPRLDERGAVQTGIFFH